MSHVKHDLPIYGVNALVQFLALPLTRWLSSFCQLLSMLELLLTLMYCSVVLPCTYIHHAQNSQQHTCRHQIDSAMAMAWPGCIKASLPSAFSK